MRSSISWVADSILEISGAASVSGVSVQEIEELKRQWEVSELPAAYVEFLKIMGRRAGRLLEGTDAFMSRIMQLPAFVAEFQSENDGSWCFPEGSLIFAMHQGYQVYYLEDVTLEDPSVALYLEGGRGPIRRWESFTRFLCSQFAEDYDRRSG